MKLTTLLVLLSATLATAACGSSPTDDSESSTGALALGEPAPSASARDAGPAPEASSSAKPPTATPPTPLLLGVYSLDKDLRGKSERFELHIDADEAVSLVRVEQGTVAEVLVEGTRDGAEKNELHAPEGDPCGTYIGKQLTKDSIEIKWAGTDGHDPNMFQLCPDPEGVYKTACFGKANCN